ncbi:MAG: tRNA (adenosine(37)-N6)-threonylcarbamoyltransferase complex dimerization subunit type 1 TsaB [Sterolibacterium sp.]|nr:tRNA (adenosine(37)-N6)-threonylcarbamoyltransferase complex dimerization subunit type 1 TsaB [Sterolibacterium sp.]
MNLLALETATQHLSVALWRDGVCHERAAEIINGGSEHLLPWVQELLVEADLDFSALDGIAFGAGPGGFTGLRLACGVTQGLACALDLPVVAVSSLEALAWVAWQRQSLVAPARQARILACLDARMNEVYCAAYEVCAGALESRRFPFVAAPQAIAEQLPSLLAEDDWLACGDGFAVYPQLLVAPLARVIADCWPTATAVAHLAAPRLARGEGVDAALAAPLYVRDKVALTTAERLARGGSQ